MSANDIVFYFCFFFVCVCFFFSILVKSFITLCKELFKEDGVTYDLREKLLQDSLQEHFAWRRRVAGTNENQMLDMFQREKVTANVVKCELISDLKGNTLGRLDTREPVSVEGDPLPIKKSK